MEHLLNVRNGSGDQRLSDELLEMVKGAIIRSGRSLTQ